MELLNIFAMVGMTINDLLAILSIIGSGVLFIGALVSKSRMYKFGRVAYWGVGGLVFGGFFQLAMAVTGSTPEMIGMVFRMTPLTATGLFVLSFLLIMGRLWLLRTR
jgi:hypothetical protein